jgi:hypothetical protein
MHPNTLHAAAAAWSLHAARTRLPALADARAAAIAAELVDAELVYAADGLQAWRPTVGRSRGVHGDPVGGAGLAAAAGRPAPVNMYQRLLDSTTATLTWLADRLRTPPGPDPLDRLAAAARHPAVAAELCPWLVDLDGRIRQALRLPPDRWPLPGPPECPACGGRTLTAQTSAPDSRDWTVICAGDCVCHGASCATVTTCRRCRPGRADVPIRDGGCPCGMTVRARGVRHIWPSTSPVVVDALRAHA